MSSPSGGLGDTSTAYIQACLRARTLFDAPSVIEERSPSTMTPHLRKLVLTAHITLSVGWFGADTIRTHLGTKTYHSAPEGTTTPKLQTPQHQ